MTTNFLIHPHTVSPFPNHAATLLKLKLCKDVLAIQTSGRLRGQSKIGIMPGDGELHEAKSGMMGSSKGSKVSRLVFRS
jgi:hypothetical protein